MSVRTLRHSGLNRESQKHRGEWILLDADREQLLSIGDRVYPMAGARSRVDYTARRYLLPVMAEAIATKRSIDKTVNAGRKAVWQCRAVPLLGVGSGRPMAVLGCYDRPDAPVTAPPLVGTWEWRVSSPGPDQKLNNFVSPAMYAVYGVSGQDGLVDSSAWQDEFVAIEHRPKTRAFFRGLLEDTDSSAVRYFDFTSKDPVDQGSGIALRCTGRRYEENDETWVGGLTFRRPGAEVETAETASLRAALMLARDPLWLVDPQYEDIYASTDGLMTHQLAVPATRNLPAMCHPDDLQVLRNLLQWVISHPWQCSEPVRVRFAARDGAAWRELDIVAVGGPVTTPFTTTFSEIWCRASAAQ